MTEGSLIERRFTAKPVEAKVEAKVEAPSEDEQIRAAFAKLRQIKSTVATLRDQLGALLPFADEYGQFCDNRAAVWQTLEPLRAETVAYPTLRQSFADEREDHERWRLVAKDEREAIQRDISRGREQYEKLVARLAKAGAR
jgi:hypothetical protein